MEENRKCSKNILIKICIIVLSIVIILYVAVSIYSYTIISDYDNKIYPNVYVNDYDISNVSRDEVVNKVNVIAQVINEEVITFTVNSKEYKISLKDLGVTLNKDALSNKILTYNNNMNSFDKLKSIMSKKKTVFNYELTYSKDTIVKYLNDLKKEVDTKGIKGKLVMDKDRNLSYKKSTSAFSLNVNESAKKIEDDLEKIISTGKATLVGEYKALGEDKLLSTIDTKVSSFSTSYNTKVSRAKNIAAAAGYLDGIILKPGQVFSFYKYAGPYNKKGYVYYDSILANGVCQVVSTVYNTTLLGGLKVVERYSHERKMTYVPGGLDATTASKANGAVIDYKFKNTYDYPIYISAYTRNGKVTVEFWSNSRAKDGKTYKTESVKMGYNAYKAYLLVFKDGKQIDKKFVNNTYYPK